LPNRNSERLYAAAQVALVQVEAEIAELRAMLDEEN
jgi:hypothetical protein